MELNKSIRPTQAEGSMDYDAFIKHIKYLIDASWGSDWGHFTSEAPNVSDPKNVKYPIITHRLDEMKPGVVGGNTREIKPRLRYSGNIKDPNGTHPKGVNVYGQVFDSEVVFEIYGETNGEVQELARDFRAVISTFTPFLKQKGLGELRLLSVSNPQRDSGIRDLSRVRRIHYYVRFEELVEVPTNILRIIDVVEKNLERELNKEISD